MSCSWAASGPCAKSLLAVAPRVNERPGYGLGRYQTGPNSKFKFEFKKKIPKPVIPAGKLIIPAGNPVKPVGIPVGTGCTCDFEFGFEFNGFLPVSGQTGPVNRYRRTAV